jgi:hypothetical protein
VRVCVCMCIYMYSYVCIYVYAHTYKPSTHVYNYTHISVYQYSLCVCCIYACMYPASVPHSPFSFHSHSLENVCVREKGNCVCMSVSLFSLTLSLCLCPSFFISLTRALSDIVLPFFPLSTRSPSLTPSSLLPSLISTGYDSGGRMLTYADVC